MSSTSFMTGTGLNQCRPTTRPGESDVDGSSPDLTAAAAILVKLMEEVLDASIASGRTCCASLAKTACLTSSDSFTAYRNRFSFCAFWVNGLTSMTRSTSENSSMDETGLKRFLVASACEDVFSLVVMQLYD